MPLCLSGNRSVSAGEGRPLLHPIRPPKDRVSRGSELAGRDGQQDHAQNNWRNKADVGGSWKWKAKGSVAQSCPTLRPHGPRSFAHPIFQARIRASIHFLLQGIFPPRDRTHTSCIAGRFFTIWATREAQEDHGWWGWWGGVVSPNKYMKVCHLL